MAPLTPVVMVMTWFIFHPMFCMVLISGSYLVCSYSSAWYHDNV